MTRRIEIPELSLVLLVGASGAGKSTFARRHFLETEVLSSDRFRAWVADDESDQSATVDAFDALRYVADKRLARGRLVVVDATNVQPEARRPFIALARSRDVLPVAIVFDVPAEICVARNAARIDRRIPEAAVRRQLSDLHSSRHRLHKEGIRQVHVLEAEAIDEVVVTRTPLSCDRRSERGPFDIIGDVHGCLAELEALLGALGWVRDATAGFLHPEGRKAIFLGDLVDRGPDSPGCLELAMRMVKAGVAMCLPGNHEARLLRKLRGKNVRLTHGLAATMEQLEARSPEERERMARFIDGLVSHFVLDEGRLVVAHAGMKEAYQGRESGRVRSFALYGATTGEFDADGLPVRADWAATYRGSAAVVYGHTPTLEAEWVNGTICIDTGCVFGGKLTALRWPERELVSVPARRVYAEATKPLVARRSGSGSVGTTSSGSAPRVRSAREVSVAKVLIIGGHGKVALRLAPLLVEQGHEVTSAFRKPEQTEDVAATGARPVVADVEKMSTDELAELIRGHDAIVWSAGAGGGNPPRTYAVDRDAAIRSMDAAKAAGVKRYVMVSYANSRPDHGVPKDHPFFPYAEAKAAADEYLRGSGLEYTILGPGRLTMDEPTGKIDVVGPDAEGDNAVSRADVAAVIAATLADDSTKGRTIRFRNGETPIAEALRA